MDGNYSLSDIRTAVDGGDGFGMGGGGFLAWILLFALFGGNGFGFGGNRGNVATTEDLASGFNFNSLQGKTNDILAAVNGVNQNIGNAICTSTYEIANKISDCCCQNQLGIQSVKFDLANYASAIQMNDTANTQKILDAITGNKIADMQAQIQQLQLQSALCGIPRTSPYGYGVYAYPTCQTGTCGTCAY